MLQVQRFLSSPIIKTTKPLSPKQRIKCLGMLNRTIALTAAIIIIIGQLSTSAYSQVNDTLLTLQTIAQPYTVKVGSYAQNLNQQIDKGIQKQIRILYKSESKLLKRLQSAKNSDTHKIAIPDYQAYANSIQTKAQALSTSNNLNNYIPQLDSLHTSLKFLDSKFLTDKFNTEQALKSITDLQNKLNYSNAIEQVLKDKQQQYKDLLSKYTGIPNRLKNSLNNYTEKIYYYKQQIQEYKNQLKDPEKLQAQALAILRELPAFQSFMKKNSFLSSIFRTDNPTDINDPSLAGLQRRNVVESQIQTQIQNGGPNAGSMVQQNLQQAKGELDKLKDKLQKEGNVADLDMPNFKPNTQKTKTFWKRLEYGANLQNQKGSSILPNTSDIALTVGYKLNDKSVIGIGTSYKLGLGSGLDNIRLSSEGISLRSYIDYKIKNSWYASGGYEQQYLSRFDNLNIILHDMNAWQQRALIGLTKKYSISKKFKGNMQLLYDVLYQQNTNTKPLVFRLGYSF